MGWLAAGGWGGTLRSYAARIYPRPQIRVRILHEYTRRTHPILHFEVENLGPTPTALGPEVTLRGWTCTRERRRVLFCLFPGGRDLPPHVPKKFEAEAVERAVGLGAVWIRTYQFCLTDGRRHREWLRSAATRSGHEALSWGRYCYHVGRVYCGRGPQYTAG
jgi:hypothetical protein